MRRARVGQSVGMHQRRLATYLNDRDAILVAGGELANRAASSNEHQHYGPPLRLIADGLAEDRDLLRSIMDAHGVAPDRVKTSFAWVGEKLGRLKPNDQISGYSPLSRVVELDGLTAIVTTLASTWASLALVLPTHGPELDHAQKRARASLERLEALRPDALKEALLQPPGVR